jgi:hypothetical protein
MQAIQSIFDKYQHTDGISFDQAKQYLAEFAQIMSITLISDPKLIDTVFSDDEKQTISKAE